MGRGGLGVGLGGTMGYEKLVEWLMSMLVRLATPV